MAKDKDTIIELDSQTLSYSGKVFPLRNIAYFEKHKVKRKSGVGWILTLTILVVVGTVLGAGSSDEDPASFLAVGAASLSGIYVTWIVYLIFSPNPPKDVLGDSP